MNVLNIPNFSRTQHINHTNIFWHHSLFLSPFLLLEIEDKELTTANTYIIVCYILHTHTYIQILKILYKQPWQPKMSRRKKSMCDGAGLLPIDSFWCIKFVFLSFCFSPSVSHRTPAQWTLGFNYQVRQKTSNLGEPDDIKNSFPTWKALNIKPLWISPLLP